MIDRKKEKEFYKKHLNEEILPFWLQHSLDETYGGYYTCFNNSGEKLISKHKYTWSQGRMVWVFSKLSMMDMYSEKQKNEFLKNAKSGADFLMKNVLCENGNCTFFTDREGNKQCSSDQKRADSSFYADCFVIIGLSMYYRASREVDALIFAKSLYKTVCKRVTDNDILTEPYPIPAGYKAHGVYMIMLNTSQEFYRALYDAKMSDGYRDVVKKADNYMNTIVNEFVSENFLINEFRLVDSEKNQSNLILEYINPGHSIEDTWFMMHQASFNNDKEKIKKLAIILKTNIYTGWDKKYGGIFAFSSIDGGKPKGSTKGIESEKMTDKLLHDWDYKLWWIHSETLYALLLAYDETKDDEFLELYKMVKEYTFATFPNENKKIGEWIQIRDRAGNAIDKKVALPVKDPFHIIRNLIYMIEML